MKKKVKPITFNPESKEVMMATDDELIRMYIKGTNQNAMEEMKARGIY